jgi:hypothetical protein
MRAAVILALVAALSPVAAGAQGTRGRGAGAGENITKEQYIERARERAAKRFEKLDTNRDGVLSPEERRASRRKKAPQE